MTASSSPPIGVGERTGLRQTTVPLVPGSVACLFTDGLIEARTADGVLGRERLTEMLDELGPNTTAKDLIARAASEARVSADDIAAVVISPTAGVTAGLFRTEQLELSTRELEGPMARRFLESCGLTEARGGRGRAGGARTRRALRRSGAPRGVRQPPARGGAPAQRGEHRGRFAARGRSLEPRDPLIVRQSFR